MSDEGEIKLKDTVVNLDYLDSEEEESDDMLDEAEPEFRERSDSIDDATEENAKVLEALLREIGSVTPIGKKIIRIDIQYPKGVKFLKKNEDTDFDTNQYGLPYLPQDGEEFILPFLEKMKGERSELKGTAVEFNVRSLKYQF